MPVRKGFYVHPLFDTTRLVILGYIAGRDEPTLNHDMEVNLRKEGFCGQFAFYECLHSLRNMRMIKPVTVTEGNRAKLAYQLTTIGKEFTRKLGLSRFYFQLRDVEKETMEKLTIPMYEDNYSISANDKVGKPVPLEFIK